MNFKHGAKNGALVAAIAVAAAASAGTRQEALAADHIDSPAASADKAADITDFYAWHEDDKLVAALGFAGLDVPGTEGTFDAGVLYGIHVDNDGDNVADQTVWVRFGEDEQGNWGVLLEGIPGGQARVIGPVGEPIDAGLNLQAFAGPRDDPFFFDFDGFQATLASGTLSFVGTRDSFQTTNVTMIVVEMSIDGVAGGSDNLNLWATSARKEGN